MKKLWFSVLILLLCLIPLSTCALAEGVDGAPVIFEGVTLESGRLYQGETPYIRLSEAAAALGVTLQEEEGAGLGFDWRKSHVSLRPESDVLRYQDADFTMEAPALPTEDGHDLLVPVYGFCDGAQIGTLYDEEFDTLYCTAAAGDWEIPQGYNVPVMMYHAVGHNDPSANLFVDTYNMEAQICYMLDNGYTPIWFSDIEHIEDYEKPVILCFDDGWKNNYSNLFPLVQKYQIKVTIFVVCNFFDRSHNHLSTEEALEMNASGLVSLQSHAVTHNDLSYLPEDTQLEEISQSQLILARKFGRIPYVLAYPIGGTTKATEEFTSQYYRFGVKMVSSVCYNTSDNPMRVWRFWPQRQTTLDEYSHWLEKSFPDK